MVGELIDGRYELEELVGSGGMSNVFRAHDRLLERTVALKILHEQFTRDEDYVERFRREARAVAQLAHPNIVTVIDRGEQDGRQFIVFEYIHGQNLKELSAGGPLDVREAIGLALQVARALSFAHERGLVHRDVKPQNVLLNDDGQAKVTDFGIARSLDVHGVTQTGTVLGTSDYIAPEQARGQQVDPKTDIYSLGAVLYELLTGEVPFKGDNFVAVAMRHVNEPPPSVLDRRPDCPLRLDLAIQRAMAKDPEERFASMDEFCAELEACLAELDGRGDEGATMIVPPPPRQQSAKQRRERRIPWMPILLVLLAALLVAGGAYLLTARRRRHSTRRKGSLFETGSPPRNRRLRPLRHRRRARLRGGSGDRSRPRDVLGQRALRQLHQGGRRPGFEGACFDCTLETDGEQRRNELRRPDQGWRLTPQARSRISAGLSSRLDRPRPSRSTRTARSTSTTWSG